MRAEIIAIATLAATAVAAPTSPSDVFSKRGRDGTCSYAGVEYPALRQSTCTMGGPYGYGMCGNSVPCDFMTVDGSNPCQEYSQFACPYDGAPCWAYNVPPIGTIAHCGVA